MGRGDGVIESNTTYNGVISKKTLTFSPLHTSHGALYTCTATTLTSPLTLQKLEVKMLVYMFKVSISYIVKYCHNCRH